jgi:predicted nuclease of predicted toxin-antitoxin system
MSFKLLIDECLSPELVEMALQAGHVESTCTRDRGLLGKKDRELMIFVVNGDFTLVTHNAKDFRGTGSEKPGGHHSAAPIHAGLICLNSVHPMDLERQRDLFRIALEEIASLTDLLNQALEIVEDVDGSVSTTIYEMPS